MTSCLASLGIITLLISVGTVSAVDIYVTDAITDDRIYADTLLTESNHIYLQSCPGEYIASSFTLKSSTTKENILPVPSDLTFGSNTITSENIDIKVVKRWYQKGGDDISESDENVRLLVPELLLNDDSLVRVNYISKTDGSNQLKLTNGNYISINTNDENSPVPNNVKDADTLQPLKLFVNQNQQYWVTFYIPDETMAGKYTGKIDIKQSNTVIDTITIELEVLPFTLPDSSVEIAIYYTMGITETPSLGHKFRSIEQVDAEMADMRKHGIDNFVCYLTYESTYWDQFIELAFSHGFTLNPFYYHANGYAIDMGNFEEIVNGVKNRWGADVYFYTKDEVSTIPQADNIAECRDAGGKTFCAQSPSLALVAIEHDPPLLDYVVTHRAPSPTILSKYHDEGFTVGSYGNPQVGLELPETYRKNYGILLWQKDVDVSMDFAYQYNYGLAWNDWDWTTYKQHMFSYPTQDGVVNTIQFEGFREGVNDIRYINKLEEVNPNSEYLTYLKTTSLSTLDMNEVRAKVIEEIKGGFSLPGFELITIIGTLCIVLYIFKKQGR